VGDDKITYLGYSYGTILGAIYADLFPDKVRAMVLDGAVDPTTGVDPTGEQHGGTYGDQDFQQAFARFAAACAAATGCSAGPDAKALLDQVRAQVEAAPLAAPTVEAEDGRKLSIGLFETGIASAQGNAVIIAAGTGMGQAYLHRVDGRLHPVASEGGHADFAARTNRELELVRTLRDEFGRVEVERVLSGPGLVNVHRFTHRGAGCPVVDDLAAEDAPAHVTQGALSGRCQFCVEALRMFVEAYGAEAGNLALRGVASAGVFIGGGIAPKILPALKNGAFMNAFLGKEPMRALLEQVPVHVILNHDAGLIGAAVRARDIPRN